MTSLSQGMTASSVTPGGVTPSGAVRRYFTPEDYVVFVAVLLISAAIGIYHAVRAGRRQTNQDFLMAGRQMKVLPVTLSLLASFQSAIVLTGLPSEIYTRGVEFLLIGVGQLVSLPLVAWLLLPVFYNLKLVSCYEYFELRFHSKIIRIIGSVLFIVQTLMYMAVVLYAPSLAVNAVTGFSIWSSILCVGLVCTFYTTIGGMKAVVWTDVFQTVVMFAGIIAAIVQGSVNVGGMGVVMQRMKDGGRFDNFHTSDAVFTYQSVVSLPISGLLMWFGVYGVNQSAVQRYCSMPTLAHAKRALYLNIVGLVCVVTVTALAGAVVYANYYTCDPLRTGAITSRDQLLPYFVMDALGYLPGLPGLFVACLFSGALSSVSSGLTSLSAVVWEDMLQPLLASRQVSETTANRLTKAVACVFGLLSVGLAFAASSLDGVIQAASSLTGMAGGPLLALFLLGMFCPFIKWRSALVGSLCGLSLSTWVSYGGNLHQRSLSAPYLATSTEACPGSYNVTLLQVTSTATPQLVTPHTAHTTDIPWYYRISYLWYLTIGCVVTLVVTLITSPILDYLLSQRVPHPSGPSEVDISLLSPPLQWALSRRARGAPRGDDLQEDVVMSCCCGVTDITHRHRADDDTQELEEWKKCRQASDNSVILQEM